MKIKPDRLQLDRLRSLSDRELWQTIRFLAGLVERSVGKNRPDEKKLRSVRAILDAVSDDDLERIRQLMEAGSEINEM